MGRKKDAIGRLIVAMGGEKPELEASIDDYIEMLVQTADVLETRLAAIEADLDDDIDEYATDEEVEEELKPKPKPDPEPDPDPDVGSQEDEFED